MNQGSDFIQSIGLNLSGIPATSIMDSKGLLSGTTINASSNQGSFQDEVDLLMPADTTLSDTLAITATAAETETPATTASATQNQSIVIDNTFSTSKQSMWTTGAAPFTTDYSTGFIGLDVNARARASTLTFREARAPVGGGSASGHLRGGLPSEPGYHAQGTLVPRCRSRSAWIPNVQQDERHIAVNRLDRMRSWAVGSLRRIHQTSR